MINDKISEIILLENEYNIPETAVLIWNHIQSELESKSKLNVLTEILQDKILSASNQCIVISDKQFSVLIYNEGQEINIENSESFFHLPLSDSNFKLIIKKIIFDKLVCVYESANFNPVIYQNVYNKVLEAF